MTSVLKKFNPLRLFLNLAHAVAKAPSIPSVYAELGGGHGVPPTRLEEAMHLLGMNPTKEEVTQRNGGKVAPH